MSEIEYQGGLCPCGWDANGCLPYSSRCLFLRCEPPLRLREPSNLTYGPGFGLTDINRGEWAGPAHLMDHNTKPKRGRFRHRWVAPDAPIMRPLRNGRPAPGSWFGGGGNSYYIAMGHCRCAHIRPRDANKTRRPKRSSRRLNSPVHNPATK